MSQLEIPLISEIERLAIRHLDEQHRELAMTQLRTDIGSPECPFKDVVYDCEIPKSSLSMALSVNDTQGHDIPLRVFFYAARRARTDRLAAIVANIRERDLKPREASASAKLGVVARWLSDNPALRTTFERDTGVRL